MSDEFFHEVPCAVCKGENFKKTYFIDTRDASQVSGIDLSNRQIAVSICKNCFHQQVQPMPRNTFIKAFYATYMSDAKLGFYSQRNQKVIPDSFRKKYGYWLELVSSTQMPKRKLLDVGTGTGMFMRLAREYNFDVSGVEPNANTAEEIEKLYKIPVYNCLFDDIKTTEKFDIVTMWDLLEHLPDPSNSIQKTREILNERGLLVMEIPVRDSFFHLLAKFIYVISFTKINKPLMTICGLHHLHYFSGKSIIHFLKIHGFSVKRMQRIETDFSLVKKRGGSRFKEKFLFLIYNISLLMLYFMARVIKKQNKLVIISEKV